ncbi:nitroreductase family deazaflavin-dependent oxidoreductase [Streptomyces sp. FIT100]|uniref:nitroreductase family deazaflavin-dependent oxidoreductase n=1 Tax=Streptomyces sp. FIT100 TaxID=2837956 RepID=UPI0021C8D25F|nr:nitroreductase family deazaflavin-dependent oxidoreductase [Streptomyces sp. FIT100]UUN25654.1 nitroreductase family deazaflavin-dependent oxidoreductase [Streptomyces sp. FIT100]
MKPSAHGPVRRPKPPTGWKRSLARLPIHMYRIGLGPLFGKRLMLLIHTGRFSGVTRKVILEVVEHDPRAGSWTVASGFGTRAQWYRNLRRTPQATIQFGRRYHAVTAHFLPAEEGARTMARYAEAHPRTAQRLCAFMGLPSDGTPEGFRRAGEQIPFVRLEPSPAFRSAAQSGRR